MGYNYLHTTDRNVLEAYKIYKYDPKSMSLIPQTSLGISETNFNRSSSLGWNLMIRPQLSYEREFGKHNVSGLLLFERYNSYGETMTGYKKGYFSDYPVDISTGLSDQAPYTSGSFSHSGMASFAGRLSYAYDKRYLAELTFRADGSYKFAPQDRWGYFPSLALGWVISEEDFMESATFLDHLKLRASAGVLGSDDTGEYLYLQTYSSTGTSYSYVWDGVAKPAFYTTGYVHDGLTWSRTNTYNVGLEMRAFNNRLSFEFDWFYKHTKNILEYGSSTYAPSLGGNNPYWDNSGEVDNRGFDMTINWGDAFASGWSYNLTGIVGWSRNKVLKKKIADDHPSYRAILGQPMGSIYGFNALGLFQTQEQVDNYPTAPSGWLELGAIMYEDINGDGKIDSTHDYVKIGRSSIPEMTFSFNAEVSWKDLSLSVLLQGATLCNYQLNGCYNNGNTDGTMFTRQFYGGGNSLLHLVSDSWTPENTDARYPRLAASTNANNAWASSWWVIDGSYLRVKNVQLSYSLPKKILHRGKNGGIDRIRLYAAGTNLFTFSAYKYLDPENPGINNGYYPQQRTFSLGVNFTF
jgi:TonB-linked SusC/RagA family outer membrane protein